LDLEALAAPAVEEEVGSVKLMVFGRNLCKVSNMVTQQQHEFILAACNFARKYSGTIPVLSGPLRQFASSFWDQIKFQQMQLPINNLR